MGKQIAFDVNAVLFDFDGVIINSAADIANSINAMLVRFKMQPLEEKKVTEFIGDGVRNLVLRSVTMSCKNAISEISVEKLEEMFSWYQSYYYNHATEKTTVYQYVPEVLETLYMLGKRAAVVSNKPKKITEEMKMAAAVGLAKLISEEELKEDYIIPGAFDPRVAETVAKEVEKVAKEQGICRE